MSFYNEQTPKHISQLLEANAPMTYEEIAAECLLLMPGYDGSTLKSKIDTMVEMGDILFDATTNTYTAPDMMNDFLDEMRNLYATEEELNDFATAFIAN